LLYYDGANLNALVGLARPVTWASTSSTSTCTRPSRHLTAGRAGSGPVGVAEALAAFLPTPTVERDGDRFLLDHDRPQSIGKVRSYYGNFGMLVRAYAYIRAYGSSISAVAENAVLNARYLQSRLRGIFPMAVASDSMHEFVATTKGSRVVGLRALDVAKRLLDYGVYAPTAYFPPRSRKPSCSSRPRRSPCAVSTCSPMSARPSWRRPRETSTTSAARRI